MPKKFRVDDLLIKMGLCEDRKIAFGLILAGKVRLGTDHVIRKTTEMLPADANLNVDAPKEYVSRGAYKLKNPLEKYYPNLSEKIALDIGASTGGFTDLMLQKNVKKVYAVDVGTSQLHYKLRINERVISLEKTNARALNKSLIPEKIDLMTMDVSFISVKKILPTVKQFLKKKALAFILIKPQFEASKEDVGNGVITNPEIRQKYVDDVCQFAKKELNWLLKDLVPSPIKGPKGNQEFLAVFENE